MLSSFVNVSGATYNNFVFPERTSFLTVAISALLRDEFKNEQCRFRY